MVKVIFVADAMLQYPANTNPGKAVRFVYLYRSI
jgi:hypothetical protein